MNTIDIVLAVFLLITAVLGIKRGLIGSIVNLLAIVAIILLVSKVSPIITFYLTNSYNIPELGASIISYFIVIVIIFILAKIIIHFLDKGIKFLNLGFINRLLGGLFGLVNGVLILLVLVIAIKLTPMEKDFLIKIQDSKILTELNKIADQISTNMPDLKKKEVDPIDKLIKKYT